MIDVEVIFLGSGTSDGVPLIGCDCIVCKSNDIRDKRLRSSIILKLKRNGCDFSLLIDTSMDLRYQFLRENISGVDAVLYTHWHSDHLLGISEIRPFTKEKSLPIYCCQNTSSDLKKRFNYFFETSKQKGGGIPKIDLNIIDNKIFSLFDIPIIPIPVLHGSISIYGYRIGPLAYITDASYISAESIKKLKGVDYLIINALRERIHPTHFNIKQALSVSRKIGPKKTWLTHISHNLKHQDLLNSLPVSVLPAYDGLKIKYSI